MIPEVFIENWRKTVPWQMTEQIQQDLMISRALVDLYNDPHVKDALVFRGGTALNKLFINPPARYSEDIDFVQKNADPIGQTIDAIRALLKPWLGDPKWKITQRSAKLIYKYESVNKMPAKLKIEINTTEHFHTCLTSSTEDAKVPPVASKSSTMRTFSPLPRESRWISTVAWPYSRS